MNRPITGFRLDDHGDWTALLNCSHAQHVRHTPPFMHRPWVTTASGRDSRLGEALHCVRCDRFELPEHVVAYQHTSLRTKHVTAAGVWARITVTEGTLRYCVDALGIEIDLAPLKEQAIYGRVFRNLAEALLHESSLTRTMPTGRISYLPMRYDAGRPKAVIRFKISQPRTTSLLCTAGLRARRASPIMDLYRKNVFSTRP